MKIVYLGKFSQDLIIAGPEKYSINLFNIISKEYNPIFIEYYFKSCNKSNFFTRLFGRENINDSQNILRLGNFRLFIFLIRFQPDVIHILTAERFTIPVYLYKIMLKGEIITTFHSILKYEIPNDPVRRKRVGRYKDYIWEMFAIKFSSKLIFLSQIHLELAEKFYSIDNNKAVIIPNGVEFEFYNPDKIIKNDTNINIVFYNGISDSIERGLDVIIALLNKLNYERIKLYIIGKEIKLTNTKFYYEFVSPMDKKGLISFLKDKQILLKSNIYDSFSIFALECMAAGLVPVVSDNVGISSFIENCQNGFIYNSKNLSEFIMIMENIINQNHNLQHISANAAKIVNILNWEKISERYTDLYKSLNEN